MNKKSVQLSINIRQIVCYTVIILLVFLSVNSGMTKKLIFLPKPKNWVGLPVVNVRADENALKLHENVVQHSVNPGFTLLIW